MIKVGKEPFLECSSKGDKRFSAMYARIKSMGNKTIEEIYQGAKVFADGKTGLSVKEAKKRKATNMNEVAELYEKLWELYLKENPELIEELLKYNGYTDIFGKEGCQCQAKSIYRIVNNIRKEKELTMKVFISGSSSLNDFNKFDELGKYLKENNQTVLVGDCKGIDTVIQKMCKQYEIECIVYHIGNKPRNNIGFKTIKVPGTKQTDKDIAMSKECNYGIAIWDNKSKGTKANIERLKEYNKEVTVITERGVTMARLTNAELLAKIEKQNKVIEELKGVRTMTESTQKPFNVYEYTLNQIANGFIESDRKKDFTITVRNLYDSTYNDREYKGSGKILESLENLGAYIIESITPKRQIVDDKEVRFYEIKISNFDPSIRAKSKNTGKEYDIFFKQLPTKALRTVAV